MPANIIIDDAPIYDSSGADDDDKSIEELRKQLPPAGSVKEPEAKEPEAKEPEAKEPEAKEPEAKEPEAKEPEAKEPETDEEEDDEPKGRMIPKQRYDSLRKRHDDLARNLDELRRTVDTKLTPKQEPAPDPVLAIDTELAALDEPLTKALSDGDVTKVRELRTKERELLNKRTDIIAERRSSSATAVMTAQTSYAAAVAKVEADYPALNPDVADTFDEALATELGELVEAYTKLGHPATTALNKATAVMKHRLDATVVKAPDPVSDAAKKVKDAETAAAAADKAAARKEGAVKKAIDAANKQPADTGKAGTDSDKKGMKGGLPDATALSDEEYDALPEETKKRMRGDFANSKAA